MATFELYRRSTIGMCLTETLDDMVSNGVLSPELAIQVLVQFDKSMTEALDSQVKSKVTIKGHLHTYRFCDNVWTFIVQDANFKYDEMQETVGQVKIVACDSKLLTQNMSSSILPCTILQPAVLSGFSDIERLSFLLHRLKPAMASMTSGKVKVFELLNGMVLQVDVSGFLSGHCAKVKLQLRHTSQTWILHWGCISTGNKKWFVPSFYPSGTIVHKKSALRTPFVKEGDAYVVVIELKDPKIHAIEFVLKDTRHNKWLKMNGASFRIILHEEIDVEQYGAGKGKCLLNEMSHKEEVEKPLTHRFPCTSALFPKLSTSSSAWQGLSRKNNTSSNIYAMSLEDTYNEMVGENSCSIRFLSKKVPTWIRFPASVVLPFGVFEKVLSEDINKVAQWANRVTGQDEYNFKDVAKKISCLRELVDKGDISKCKTIQETVLQLKAPRRMGIEVRKKMKSSRIPWPRGPGEDTWSRVWQAIKQLWASKWNERTYISCRRAYMNHDKLCIGILIQEQIRADYAFVTYTNHPVSRDSSEIYTEIVNGSVETLVGASPGRAMSSITKKSDLKSPIVTCYPSKSIGLYTKNKKSIILRPDFLSENTNGYTCAGTHDSLSMENKEEVVLDYSRDPLVIDLSFQSLIHSKIAEAAKIIEDAYECAQDIEGVVQDGEVYLLQCRPLIL